MAYRYGGYGVQNIMSPSEAEINNFFNNQRDALYSQQLKLSEDIDRWANNAVRRINENVSRQKSLLKNQYEKQLRELSNKQRDFIEARLVFVQSSNLEEVQRLVEQCRSLKYTLGALEYSDDYIPLMQLTQPKKLDEAQQGSFDVRQTGGSPSQNRPQGDTSSAVVTYTGSNNTFTTKPISPTTMQTK